MSFLYGIPYGPGITSFRGLCQLGCCVFHQTILLVYLCLLSHICCIRSFRRFTMSNMLIIGRKRTTSHLMNLTRFKERLHLIFALFNLRFNLTSRNITRRNRLFFVTTTMRFRSLKLILYLRTIRSNLFRTSFRLLFRLTRFNFQVFLTYSSVRL